MMIAAAERQEEDRSLRQQQPAPAPASGLYWQLGRGVCGAGGSVEVAAHMMSHLFAAARFAPQLSSDWPCGWVPVLLPQMV